MLLEFVSLILIVTLTWFLKTCYDRRGLPPGPFPLPIIGNLHLILDDDFPFSTHKFREKYGEIFTIVLPTGNIVMANDTATAREALITNKDFFQGRIPDVVYPVSEIMEGKDVVTTDMDNEYRRRRKTMSMALHVFGEGRRNAATNVNDALTELFIAIEKMNGQPFCPREAIERSIVTHLWRWISSKKDSIDDGFVDRLLDFLSTIFGLYQTGILYQILPILKYFPTKHRKAVEHLKNEVREIFMAKTEEHEKTHQEGEHRDIIDSLLSECKKVGLKSDRVGFFLTNILGGTDTTSTFIVWFVLYMMLHQDLQGRLQAEVDEVLQEDDVLQWKDVDKLPYLQATVCEIMRLCVAVSLPHNPMKEAFLQGYRIPKETTLFFNYHCIHRDEKVWQNPALFNPDRFLDANGKFLGWRVKPGLMPFGIGTRACPGANLAKVQILIFASGMLKKYTFEVNEAEPYPTLERGKAEGKFPPKPFTTIARKR